MKTSNTPPPRESGRSWLEDLLTRMEALYKLFGRDGLNQYPLPDLQLLLSSKQLALEAARGRHLSGQEAESNRLLTLEVQDIAGCVQAQLASLQRPPKLTLSQLYSQEKQPQQHDKPRSKDRGLER